MDQCPYLQSLRIFIASIPTLKLCKCCDALWLWQNRLQSALERIGASNLVDNAQLCVMPDENNNFICHAFTR
eukprot:977362-Karenia_brevis.AAC.1